MVSTRESSYGSTSETPSSQDALLKVPFANTWSRFPSISCLVEIKTQRKQAPVDFPVVPIYVKKRLLSSLNTIMVNAKLPFVCRIAIYWPGTSTTGTRRLAHTEYRCRQKSPSHRHLLCHWVSVTAEMMAAESFDDDCFKVVWKKDPWSFQICLMCQFTLEKPAGVTMRQTTRCLANMEV